MTAGDPRARLGAGGCLTLLLAFVVEGAVLIAGVVIGYQLIGVPLRDTGTIGNATIAEMLGAFVGLVAAFFAARPIDRWCHRRTGTSPGGILADLPPFP